MLCGFNVEWLIVYTNQTSSSLKTMPFFITLFKRKRLRFVEGISFHSVTFSTQIMNINMKRISSRLFVQMAET